tara:strand:+ start:62 stop:361 length:300 start_codon:yes stop_codon:yes gene_type:complete
MKKTFLISLILVLIVITTITKNSTQEIENKIFSKRENISALKDKYEFVLLDYNFLSSPEKLLEYQTKYFEKDLISRNINEIKKIDIRGNNLIIKNLIKE